MFHITKEAEGAKPGFNFWLPFRKISTIFRLRFVLPIKRERVDKYVSPYTKNVCFGFKVTYFHIYFRLRRFWPDFYDFVVETYEYYNEKGIIETREEWEDKQRLFEYFDATVGWGGI